jgi:hypothetical protein
MKLCQAFYLHPASSLFLHHLQHPYS